MDIQFPSMLSYCIKSSEASTHVWKLPIALVYCLFTTEEHLDT